ncbi:MAG: hypothetical protein CVV64_02205 [Candidatus Wallbacteria bacterium HGW-Wallbacteria-1]|jgi:tRNA1(Val) A37 N6-methylase TrmN6|uniref:Methyltransferase small domain-containing protein n=1 Tax=Candidatus Wallbacteria bacterium HGW-Wallbacteria-1 TaxID=2013854 RepID=A0A2N1PV75_9BACT|nr:MAG: hypothetical protein CVV64_02205 [Candidatus Wallbacteria bacterium HGW-Wallbacteria-1]
MSRALNISIRDLLMLKSPEIPSFTIDPILLLHNTPVSEYRKIADLGSGTGILPFLIWSLNPHLQTRNSIVGFEREKLFLDHSMNSLALNPQISGISFLEQDIRFSPPSEFIGSFDLVLSNPPFIKMGHGKLSPNPAKNAINFETDTKLIDFFSFASKILRPDGILGIFMKADRMEETFRIANETGYTPLVLRIVHSTISSPGRAFLLYLRRGGKSTLKILPPLVVHGKDGTHSDEVENYFASINSSGCFTEKRS